MNRQSRSAERRRFESCYSNLSDKTLKSSLAWIKERVNYHRRLSRTKVPRPDMWLSEKRLIRKRSNPTIYSRRGTQQTRHSVTVEIAGAAPVGSVCTLEREVHYHGSLIVLQLAEVQCYDESAGQLCKCSTLASTPAFQAGQMGSIPITCFNKKNNVDWY